MKPSANLWCNAVFYRSPITGITSNAAIGIVVLLWAVASVRPAAAQLPDVFDADPDRLDMLIVIAHPDDEGTFGGLLPFYAGCRGKSIKLLSLTSGEWGHGLPHHASADQTPDYSYDDSDQPRHDEVPADALYPCYFREIELARMLIASGVRYAPDLPRYRDASDLQPWGDPSSAFELWGGRDGVVRRVAETVRRVRPDVVVTMAEDGFNRNPQHLAASIAARAAVPLAADPAADVPGQPWQVAKLYTVVTNPADPVAGGDPDPTIIEGIEDQLHVHDWTQPCDGLPTTPQIRAAEANALHRSQSMPNACAPSTRFILRHTTVGPDIVNRNDLFENLRPR